MQTPIEMALEAEIKELRRKVEYMERQHGPCEMFLGYPLETREMPSPHLETISLPKVASWTCSENYYHVPMLIGHATDKARNRLELSLYCTPHPGTKDAVNALGVLHLEALKRLAAMYREH